ncbi:telomerase RNA component interacting RNase [Rhinophrynus dorsalis]
MAEKKRPGEPNEDSGEKGEEGEDAAEAPPKPDIQKPESPEKPQEDEIGEDAAVPDSPPALPGSPNEDEAPLSSHSKQASPHRSPGYTGPAADFPAAVKGSPGYCRGSPLPYKGSWAPHYYRFQSASPAACSGAQDFASSAAATSAPMATNSSSGAVNAFANDGSFLELFKKKMEASAAGSGGSTSTTASSSSSTTTTGEAQGGGEAKSAEPEKRRPVSFVGKRRGGAKLALKTGMVAKKPKTEEEEVLSSKGGAWAQYMAEVKKYKAHQCGDDDKTRPLVK